MVTSIEDRLGIGRDGGEELGNVLTCSVLAHMEELKCRITFMQVGHTSVKFELLQQTTSTAWEVGRPEETLAFLERMR